MAELETNLIQLNSAIERGEISVDDLDSEMDLDDADEEQSFVDTESDTCTYKCDNKFRVPLKTIRKPVSKYRPYANGCGASGDGFLKTIIRKVRLESILHVPIPVVSLGTTICTYFLCLPSIDSVQCA
jgi:hypothetical protein